MLSEYQTERVIEIGPTDTLTNMMKRTRDLKYRRHDTANSIDRRFFSSRGNKHHIYHTADASPKASKSAARTHTSAGRTQKAVTSVAREVHEPESMKVVPVVQMPTAAVIPQSASASAVSLVPATAIPVVKTRKSVSDEPIKATEVVRAVVSCSLKKAPTEVSFTSTVKGLAGGQLSHITFTSIQPTKKHCREIYDSK